MIDSLCSLDIFARALFLETCSFLEALVINKRTWLCALLLSLAATSAPAQSPGPTESCHVADPTGTPLNLRSGPNGRLLGALQNGLPVGVVEQVLDDRGRPWVFITGRDGTTLGWVFREYLSCPSDISITDAGVAGAFYYVDNTVPPDAFLALRTYPSAATGKRIMEMPNGTVLQVLQRRADGWWYVKVVPTGQTGWAKSRAGKTVWIYCCLSRPGKTTVAAPAPASAQPPATDQSKAISEIQRVLGNILFPATEKPEDWMLRVAAVPVQEQQFCRIIDRFYGDLANVYRARNDIKKNALYRDRLRDLTSLLPAGSFENWVVRVIEVIQASDGSAAIVLQPPCRAMLASDACGLKASQIRATIQPDSPMFRELSRLNAGDFAIVNGTILYAQDSNPDRPLPTYALYEPGTYCSSTAGGKQEDTFVTEIGYLVGMR